MADVWIPSLLRDLTAGQRRLTIPADTVGDIVMELEKRFPGIEQRLAEGGRIRPGIAVVVNGEVNQEGLRRRLDEDSEVHFLPSLSGGE